LVAYSFVDHRMYRIVLVHHAGTQDNAKTFFVKLAKISLS